MVATVWERIHEKIKNDIKVIFKDYDMNELTDMQKRRIIYDYLYSNITYDSELFVKIAASRLNMIERFKRSIPQELYDVVFKKKGVCNSIGQYYKLLLDELDIPSYYVVCNMNKTFEEFGFDQNDKIIPHALNVVYDIDSDKYSFDDISWAIIKKDLNSYFDFDLNTAYQNNLGQTEVLKGIKFKIIDELYIDMISGRRDKTHIRDKNLQDIYKVKKFLNDGIDYYSININNSELTKDKVIK